MKLKAKKIAPLSENPDLDKVISQVESGLHNLNQTQNYLAMCADALQTRHHDDPYVRGALSGVLPHG